MIDDEDARPRGVQRWIPTGRHRAIWPEFNGEELHQDEYVNEAGETEWRASEEKASEQHKLPLRFRA